MPPGNEQPLPNWRQALMLLGAGLVIFMSSCLGAMSGWGGPFDAGKALLILGMILGSIGVISGVVLVLILTVVSIVRAMRRTKHNGT